MTQFDFLYIEYKIICLGQAMVRYLPDGLSLALRLVFRIFIFNSIDVNDTILHTCTICPVILL